MRTSCVFILCLWCWVSADQGPIKPFESDRQTRVINAIDTQAFSVIRAQGLEPARLCSDAVFVRRVYLDVLGTLPDADTVLAFLSNRKSNKRAGLIEELLSHEAFSDYWALKWCDVLRVKAEFPINLWPNAVQAYHRWIYDCLKQNLPYDQMAREMLTASGSNFRTAQVNFYRAVQGREPAALAAAVGLTFMGTRLDTWPKSKQDDMARFFSKVAFKGTAEWKEEIVFPDPNAFSRLDAVLPDGTRVHVKADEDPRVVFANWLITPETPWFARAIVNRIWAWLFGRGLIHEADDIRWDSTPAHAATLALLEKKLVQSHYDLRQVYRLILNSHTYQQSSVVKDPRAEALFACYPLRRLEAEVLIDALCDLTGTRESYSSPIPEPFTFIPEEHRSIELYDGSITSQFLEMFGRPARDTGLMSERSNAPSEAQRLHLLNSTHIRNKITRSAKINALIRNTKGKPSMIVNRVYFHVLSRNPSLAERKIALAYFEGKGKNSRAATQDLVWALINTKEFLYRH
ncbi:MAG: DUF1553 domain-containing protein [Phycisphaeraceae bacterium]|nr:DUF1553 domain-containing protein [Phycisphaeraceae bacterium]